MKKRLPLFLAYLVLVTFSVTVASFSRYTVVRSASDTAVAAKVAFDYVPISATLNGTPIPSINGGISIGSVQPGSVLVYSFHIRNFKDADTSEVLMKYLISVSFDPSDKVIPLMYVLTPNGTYPSAGGGWIYLNHGTQTTHSYTLTVIWPQSEDNAQYAGKAQSVRIKVDAEQANGYS